MANTPDSSRVLAQQTIDGLLKWEVRAWDENGAPNSWSAEGPDGRRYSVGVGQSEIEAPEGEEGEIEVVFDDSASKELLAAIEANAEQQ